MTNPFDMFDGKGLEYDHVQRLLAAQQSYAQHREVIDQVEEARAREQSKPQCPYCGGRLSGKYELCMHCRSPLSWVMGQPCKPGQEKQLEKQLALEMRQQAIDAAKLRIRNDLKRKRSLYCWIAGGAFGIAVGRAVGINAITADANGPIGFFMSVITCLFVTLIAAYVIQYCFVVYDYFTK